MQWNYQKIEYFLKVAETLNFSKAAKELYISPQSLNKQIIQLEQELGENLFERTTRQVKLTPLGRKMQQVFLPAREEFSKAVGSIERYMQRRKRTIRIAFFQAVFSKDIIEPMIERLRSLDGDLQVELLGGELDDLIEWLYQGKCDLVITNIPNYEEWKNAEIIPFMRAPAKIVVPLHHPWVQKSQITMKDLEEMPILLLERRNETPKSSFYRNLKVKEREYVPNIKSMLANLEVGNAYAIMPKLFSGATQLNVKYLDLPKECEFVCEMSAIYLKDSRMAELFGCLKELAMDSRFEME